MSAIQVTVTVITYSDIRKRGFRIAELLLVGVIFDTTVGGMEDPARTEQLATVHRALTALELIAANGSLNLTQLASMMGVGMATAHRIAVTLTAREWIIKESDLSYRIGEGMTRLLAPEDVAVDIRTLMRPLLEDLWAKTGETIHLTKLDGRHVVYLDQLVSTQPVHSVSRVGGRSPAHCVSPGIAQLSLQNQEYLDWFLAEPLQRHTKNSITDPSRFRALLAKVRARGFAVNLGGYQEDVGGVSVALKSPNGTPIAALSVCAPVFRFKSTNINGVGELLMETALAAQNILEASKVSKVA